MKQDALTMTLLFDYYAQLLTQKQRLCFDLYYNQDLSLGEIAEQSGITRQSVHDTLTRAEALLEEFEKQLGCIERDQRVRRSLAVITDCARALSRTEGAEAFAQKILCEAEAIKEYTNGI